MYDCVQTRGDQRRTQVVFHRCLSYSFGILSVELSWKQAPTVFPSPSSNVGVIDTCSHAWLLCRYWGSELRSSCIHRKSSYPLNCLPSPYSFLHSRQFQPCLTLNGGPFNSGLGNKAKGTDCANDKARHKLMPVSLHTWAVRELEAGPGPLAIPLTSPESGVVSPELICPNGPICCFL